MRWKLKTLLNRAGVTQREFAERVGMTDHNMSKIIRGARTTEETLHKLLRAASELDPSVTIADITEGVDLEGAA